MPIFDAPITENDMARRYGSFTPARAAALRKAQLASAAKRRGTRRVKYVKRAAVGVGVLGAIGAGAYGAHKAVGGRAIISGPHTPIPGSKSGVRFKRYQSGAVSVSTQFKGKEHIGLYAPHVAGKKVGGVSGKGPVHLAKFTPSKGDFKNMRKFNKPIPGSEQYAREAMVVGHTTAHTYTGRKIEAGEAIRRTRAYVQAQEASGKHVNVAHHTAASNFFAAQPRYTSGSVKPLRRKTSKYGRKKQNRFYSKRNSSVSTPTVLGSKRRTK